MSKSELDQLRERYARRSRRYEAWAPCVYMARQELERNIIQLLTCSGQLPRTGRSLLEVGCGTGEKLCFFLGLGFEPWHVVGSELLESRVVAARAILPTTVRIVEGDATSVALPDESFDVVFQSLVFSSILDDDFQARLARRMWALARPGGGVLWYDFVHDNPTNPDVRGVPLSRVRRLFPAPLRYVRWLTLAPPLSRLMAGLHPSLYTLFNTLPPLRTHRLCWIPKPHNGTES